MKLIVGLGNPGYAYRNSRHNIGFSVIKSLTKIYKLSLKKDKAASSLSAKARINQENVILATPVTFMNMSGIAVAQLVKKYRIDLNNLLVVCDDLDLEFARLKLRPRGSSGGHRGIKSIIDSLGSQEFARLRIGIGRPRQDLEASEYVLSSFSRTQKCQLKDIIEKACMCCKAWITEGITEGV